MKLGMLWFDDSTERDIVAKINRAVHHYEAKYGMRPDLCYVHPSTLIGKIITIPELTVKGTNMVLPHHIWVGKLTGGKKGL